MAKQKYVTQLTTRSPCPVAGALDIIGDKWTMVVVRDLILGKTKFGEFLESPEKITSNILTERLKRLESMSLVERSLYQNNPDRYEYHLTAMGRDLRGVLAALKNWGIKHLNPKRSVKCKALPQTKNYTQTIAP